MVNASRHFDTVSIYALTAGDANDVLRVAEGVDPDDPFGRARPQEIDCGSKHGALRIAVPRAEDRQFFGNDDAALLFQDGVDSLASLGHEIVPIEFTVFAETSRMMFDTAWLAERYAAVGDFVEAHPDAVAPVVRDVILGAKQYSAAEAFSAIYCLKQNAATVNACFADVDVLAVPTVGTT